MAKQIKVFVNEISLAFNPANRKKFILKKDMEENMWDEIIEILKDTKVVFKEDEIVKYLKDTKLSDAGKNAVLAISKILKATDGEIPDTFFPEFVKALPEFSKMAKVVEIEKDPDLEALKTLKKDLTKDLTESITKELREEQNMGDKVIDALKKEVDLEKEKTTQLIKDLAKEKTARRTSEIQVMVKEGNFPGDFDKVVKSILDLDNTPEIQETVIQTLKDAGEALKASGILDEKGSSKEGDDKSAVEQLMEKAKEIRKDNPDMTEAESMRQAGKENPELFKDQFKGSKEGDE